jgi:hypothetical protein
MNLRHRQAELGADARNRARYGQRLVVHQPPRIHLTYLPDVPGLDGDATADADVRPCRGDGRGARRPPVEQQHRLPVAGELPCPYLHHNQTPWDSGFLPERDVLLAMTIDLVDTVCVPRDRCRTSSLFFPGHPFDLRRTQLAHTKTTRVKKRT